MATTRRTFLLSMGGVAASVATGTYTWRRRWEYIVIHHSAGNSGSIAMLQAVHRQRRPGDAIDAIPYHYLIGNGNGMGMGEIASDWRQHYDLWGSHVSARNWTRNWRGIGICLIGNFELYPVPQLQYDALVALSKDLQNKYGISVKNINGHGHISGESTLCPGRFFPMRQLLQDIA